MPVFQYRARDTNGRSQRGVLTADSAAEGRQVLRDRRLLLEQFRLATATAKSQRAAQERSWVPPGGTRRNRRVADFARYLSLLLRSGVPLAEALEVLVNQQRQEGGGRRWETVLRDLRDRIHGGQALSEAMALHRRWFDALVLGVVQVGQETGRLEEALAELAGFLRARQALASQLTTAMAYPLILLVTGVGVVLFLMVYVIPKLLGVLEAAGRSLPLSTTILKAVSDTLIHRWPWLLAGLGIASVIVAVVLRTPRGRDVWQRGLLRVTLWGSLIRKSLVARLARQLSMLLEAGMPFKRASGLALTCCFVATGCASGPGGTGEADGNRGAPAGEDAPPTDDPNGDEGEEFQLLSPAFADGGTLPTRHTADGEGLSPALEFAGLPDGTIALALTVLDLDAPGGTFIHWVIYNIPATVTGLDEAIPSEAVLDDPAGASQGRNDFGDLGYGAPDPPPGVPHRYVFTLHALDQTLDLVPEITAAELQEAVQGHILEETQLTATYGR